jgi:hypothetical protein
MAAGANYRFPFDSYRNPARFDWYVPCTDRAYQFNEVEVKVRGDRDYCCNETARLYDDERYRIGKILAIRGAIRRNSSRSFILQLRPFLMQNALMIHKHNRECICNSETREYLYNIINVFDLIRGGVNRKFLDIYLNMLASIHIEYVGSHENDLAQNYLETILCWEINHYLHEMHPTQDDIEKIIHLINKLHDQYGFRVYLVDFLFETRSAQMYPRFEVNDRKMMNSIDGFLDGRRSGFDLYNPMVRYNQEFDYNAILIYTYQLVRINERRRYDIDGENLFEVLFLRRLLCVVQMIMGMNVMDYEEADNDDDKFIDQFERACSLICWLMTLKKYFNRNEWESIGRMIRANDSNTVIRDTDELFDGCHWNIEFEDSGCYELLEHVFSRI